jgi:hypothetical protein
LRIVEAFDAVLAAKALHVHASVKLTKFIEEMREWVPGGKCRDDGLDAVAGALSQQPVRVGTRVPSVSRGMAWQGSVQHIAKNNFNVME